MFGIRNISFRINILETISEFQTILRGHFIGCSISVMERIERKVLSRLKWIDKANEKKLNEMLFEVSHTYYQLCAFVCSIRARIRLF